MKKVIITLSSVILLVVILVFLLYPKNELTNDKQVTAISPEKGVFTINAKAIILAMGCRERSKGALNIAGTRPAGIYSAGAAQKLVNIKGYLPGKEVVILGSRRYWFNYGKKNDTRRKQG